jgi:hypothetical protein
VNEEFGSAECAEVYRATFDAFRVVAGQFDLTTVEKLDQPGNTIHWYVGDATTDKLDATSIAALDKLDATAIAAFSFATGAHPPKICIYIGENKQPRVHCALVFADACTGTNGKILRDAYPAHDMGDPLTSLYRETLIELLLTFGSAEDKCEEPLDAARRLRPRTNTKLIDEAFEVDSTDFKNIDGISLGRGLKAKIDMQEGQVLKIPGRLFTQAYCDSLKDTQTTYFFKLDHDTVLCSTGLLNFMNDPRKVEGAVANFRVYTERYGATLTATKDIKAGALAWCEYGRGFWDAGEDNGTATVINI